ncbi:protease complex subunit PrcB family protein [Slackia heliotrinireducens]|uniref:protease complex subunit PrcB family protein n=1 Tax=Slackia heliotrinireducens TaxID=84110 RepID=UPI003316088E
MQYARMSSRFCLIAALLAFACTAAALSGCARADEPSPESESAATESDNGSAANETGDDEEFELDGAGSYVEVVDWQEVDPSEFPELPDPSAAGERGFQYVIDKTGGQVFLFVCSGERPSSGYEIAVDDVRAIGADYTVAVTETEPAVGDVTAQMITYPQVCIVFSYVELPETISVVTADHEHLERTCP